MSVESPPQAKLRHSLLLISASQKLYRAVKDATTALSDEAQLHWARSAGGAERHLLEGAGEVILLDADYDPVGWEAQVARLREYKPTSAILLISRTQGKPVLEQAAQNHGLVTAMADQLSSVTLPLLLQAARQQRDLWTKWKQAETRSHGVDAKDQTRTHRLELIEEIFSTSSMLVSQHLFDRVCRLLTDQFGYDRVSYGRVGREMIYIEHRRDRIAYNRETGASEISRNSPTIIAQAVNQNRVINARMERTSASSNFDPSPTIQAELAIPVRLSGQTIGVLDIQCENPECMTGDDLVLLKLLANQLGRALENARNFQIIKEQRSRLGAMIASSRDGILMVGLDYEILVINHNAVQMLNAPGSPDLWTSASLFQLVRAFLRKFPEHRKLLFDELRRIQHGNEVAVEGTLQLNRFHYYWMSLPVLAGILPMGRLIILRDVTRDRQVELMRDELTHTIVHDLRSPLTAISLSLGLLEESGRETMVANEMRVLKVASENAQRMLKLVDNILDVNQLESGTLNLQRENLLVDVLLKEAFSTHQPLIVDKDLVLETHFPPFMPTVYVDGRMIARVLQNLLDNAIKFSPQGAKLVVTVGVELLRLSEEEELEEEVEPVETLVISVQDFGPGISDDLQDRVFEKFVTGRTLGKGSGLGLAFCKLAVESHGGHIWVASTSLEGTTIKFTLPLTP